MESFARGPVRPHALRSRSLTGAYTGLSGGKASLSDARKVESVTLIDQDEEYKHLITQSLPSRGFAVDRIRRSPRNCSARGVEKRTTPASVGGGAPDRSDVQTLSKAHASA